ncbi:DNA-directed RNA polymerase subunit beta' [compost metagenome]
MKVPDSEKRYLLSLKPEDITFDVLIELFADRAKMVNGKVQEVKSRVGTSDTMELSPSEYFNKTKITTTAGSFIYNKIVIEPHLKDIIGYVNDTINASVLSDIEDKLANALLDDKINSDVMDDYLNRTQWIAMQFHSVISGSFTMKSLKPIPSVIKLRDKLIKENKEKLDQGDITVSTHIEKQLLDLARKELGDDHGMDLYNSGARGSFGNNFKNISVMKGAVYDPTTGKFDVVKSNFMEGISKEELPVHGNAVVTGAYPKAIGTATSGYFSKQIIAALQAVTLDKKGSDCGTLGTLKVKINPKSPKDYLFCHIVENGKLVLLTEENISKYAGKEVNMRSPMYCIGKKLCRTCAGLMYEKLGIDNIGLTAARVSSTLLNLSMKKFHNSTTAISKVNIDDMIM